VAIRGAFSVFRRASTAESRPLLKEWLVPKFTDRVEGIFRDSLEAAKHVKIAKGSLDRFRSMVVEPLNAEGTEPLVTWDGGDLSPAAAREWLTMLLPDARSTLAIGSDSMISAFLVKMSWDRLLLPLASPLTPESAAWRVLQPAYLAQLDTVTRALTAIGGSPLSADAATRLMDSLTLGGYEYHQLPGTLPGILRTKFPTNVDRDKVQEVFSRVQIAWRLKHANDAPPRKLAIPGKPKPTP
jgi:hypothetical protein